MRRRAATVVVVVIASALTATPAFADPSCDTYMLIGARGTDEAPHAGESYENDQYVGTGILADRVFDTLQPIVSANGGTMARYGVRYAADMDLGGFATEIVNAEYNWSFDNEWDVGVAVGSADLVNKIESMYPVCPGTKYILVGYSQGADVVGEAIDELSLTLRSRIAATALFGDPRFNPNDTAANMEAIDPENYDWQSVVVSDVRAFIGDVEYSFSGGVLVHSMADPMTAGENSIVLTIEGSPGDGSLEILREFIQHGTVAFRVNDGDYNVVKLAASPTEAESYFPSP